MVVTLRHLLLIAGYGENHTLPEIGEGLRTEQRSRSRATAVRAVVILAGMIVYALVLEAMLAFLSGLAKLKVDSNGFCLRLYRRYLVDRSVYSKGI